MPDPELQYDLQNIHVVVTRPVHQAKGLCELIERHGGHAIMFPVLEIVPKIDGEFLSLVSHLSEYQLALFISPNAVNLALPAIKGHGGIPAGVQIGAVGRATASALNAQGCNVDIFPESKFDSESLLALPALQKVQNQRIIIFRGEGGRELLADVLRERGATVQYAQCYQRVKPNHDPQPLLERWVQHQLDIIIVTSVEGLNNLVDMVGSAGRKPLLATPLLTVSERMTEQARQLGFKSPIICAAKAADEAMVDALTDWVKQRQPV